MNNIIALIAIALIFSAVVYFSGKPKLKLSVTHEKLIDPQLKNQASIFGPVTFILSVLLFSWGIFCFFGGPEGEGGLKPIMYGFLFTFISIIIGYKSI